MDLWVGLCLVLHHIYVLDSSGSSVINPKHEIWCTQDQCIINMIGQTLSSAATSCVVGSKTSFDL